MAKKKKRPQESLGTGKPRGGLNDTAFQNTPRGSHPEKLLGGETVSETSEREGRGVYTPTTLWEVNLRMHFGGGG